jgi:hypothetical protein
MVKDPRFTEEQPRKLIYGTQCETLPVSVNFIVTQHDGKSIKLISAEVPACVAVYFFQRFGVKRAAAFYFYVRSAALADK